eukprot:symbB.v1.2.022422.t1/scaffold1989.1/size93477/10
MVCLQCLSVRSKKQAHPGEQKVQHTSISMSDAEVAALALLGTQDLQSWQLDELEGPGDFDPSLLAAQFQEYDDKPKT